MNERVNVEHNVTDSDLFLLRHPTAPALYRRHTTDTLYTRPTVETQDKVAITLEGPSWRPSY